MLEINKLKKQFLADLTNNVPTEALNVKYLGRKSQLNQELKNLKNYPERERRLLGQKLNQLKAEIQSKIAEIAQHETNEKIYDFSIPADDQLVGTIHPVRECQHELVNIFSNLGFKVALGPELEDDWHNFGALNIDENHPARDDQDSFYVDHCHCLRTQTSSVQLHVLSQAKPPIRVVAPGKTFRRDESDSTHSPMFHQLEGMIVDQQVNFSSLKGTLDYFARRFFGDQIKTRFRIGYFPFVEPGAEMDVSCAICSGHDPSCAVCKGTGWLEILGCGMVHPQVLKNAQIDPALYQGFAFGMGIERIIMLRYQVLNLRQFYENDIRFLKQFIV